VVQRGAAASMQGSGWGKACCRHPPHNPSCCASPPGAADVVTLGDAWLGAAVKQGLLQPIPSAETYR
jgi:hypothetical protein